MTDDNAAGRDAGAREPSRGLGTGSKAPASPPGELETDLVLVGAGPVGLYGAYYSGFRGLRTVVVDSLPELGGQISAMYPEKFIRDVAGYPRSAAVTW